MGLGNNCGRLASYPVGCWELFLYGKSNRSLKLTTEPPSSVDAKNVWSFTPVLPYLRGMAFKHKDKFVFTSDHVGSLDFQVLGLVLKLYLVSIICSNVLVTKEVRIHISTYNSFLRHVS
jgi:hypothetical protein